MGRDAILVSNPLAAASAGPLLATQGRYLQTSGALMPECWHTGWWAVASPEAVLATASSPSCEPGTPTIWLRSTAKLIQASLLVAAGLHTQVSAEQLAIACASHDGSAYHQRLVAQWLKQFGLTDAHLQCGCHPPVNRDARHALIHNDETPRTCHHNCSGKHAAMLALCQHHGWPLDTYLHADHPLQHAIHQALLKQRHRTEPLPMATDGCGVPTFALPLNDLAQLAARLPAEPTIAPLLDAIAAHPVAFGGEGRVDTSIVQASNGRVIAKVGADGVMLVCHREQKLGLGLKVASGDEIARNRITVALLQHWGWVDNHPLLEKWQTPVIRNGRGDTIGAWDYALPAPLPAPLPR